MINWKNDLVSLGKRSIVNKKPLSAFTIRGQVLDKLDQEFLNMATPLNFLESYEKKR